MKLVRGILVATAASLVLAGAPTAHAAETAPTAPQAGKDWQVLKTWKKGTVRACRTAYDSEAGGWTLAVQLVNRAERGRRGAVLAAKEHGADGPWDQMPVEPIVAGSKQIVFRTEVPGRPGLYDFRARVTKGEDRSSWGPSVRLSKLDIC